MTVETEVSSIRYTGIIDGTPLAAPFPVQATTDLKVYYGDNVEATEGIHYTVALNAPDYLTADVTPLTGFAVLSDGIISINRDVPYLQTLDVPVHAKIASSRLEQICDRLTFMTQQLRDQLARAVKFPFTDPSTSLGAIPAAADRASLFFGFDANGNPIAVESATPAGTPFSTFGIAWAASDGLIRATGAPTGRYLEDRFADVTNVLDHGVDNTGAVDNSAAFVALAAKVNAGTVRPHLVFPPGNYMTNGGKLVFTVPTHLEAQGKAYILDAAGSTGNLLQFDSEYCRLEGFGFSCTQSPALTDFVRVRASRFAAERLSFNGTVRNPSTPGAAVAPTGYAINVQGAAVAQYDYIELHHIDVFGGQNGIGVQGSNYLDASDINCYDQKGFGMIVGLTLPARHCRVADFNGYRCGQYAFSLSFITAAAINYAYPYADLRFEDMYAEKCGWNAYYTGANATIGAGKYGFDITDTGLQRCNFRGRAHDCAAGGLELKYSVPIGVTLVPSGQKNINIDIDVTTHRDYGQGVILTGDATTVPAGALAGVSVEFSATLIPPPAWTTNELYEVFDCVAADGYVWLCLGDATGLPGRSGAAAPAAGTSATLVTNALTAGGNAVLHIDDTTSVSVGQHVFGGSTIPDGVTVQSKTAGPGGTVTLTAPTTGGGIANGASIIFATEKNDGTLIWRAFKSDASAASTSGVGIEIRASTGCTVTGETTKVSRGAYLNAFDSSDDSITDLVIRGLIVRDALYGIQDGQSDGSGALSNTRLIDCDVEARSIALHVGNGGVVNDKMHVLGGRFIGTAAGSFGIRGGTGTLSNAILDGGTLFSAPYSAAYMEDAGTRSVKCGAVTFATVAGAPNTPCRIDGAGTWNWGQASAIYNADAANFLGWQTVAGAVAITGRVQRTDLGNNASVVAAGAGTQKAGRGEFFTMDAPTATEWGYFCRGGAYNWQKLTLS